MRRLRVQLTVLLALLGLAGDQIAGALEAALRLEEAERAASRAPGRRLTPRPAPACRVGRAGR
ncbi:MAG TPA: hypothetical protein VFW32_10940 [Actinomycetes bacterium]|nr:hypothetical protein [Actinomycetes bacterium]